MSSAESPRLVSIVGEIGPADDPIEVRTEPLPSGEGEYTAYVALLKMRGWRNVRGEAADD